MGDRADLGFGEALDGFDPADWTPKPKRRPKAAPEERAASRRMAEATGFRSREPQRGTEASSETTKPKTGAEQGARTETAKLAPAEAASTSTRPRRRRTGRNAQFNIKARPETIEAFCAVADAKGWGLGETLEQAVALLEEHHGKG